MPETFTEAHYPKAGLDLSRAFFDQQPRQVLPGLWARTTAIGSNVRCYESLTDRARGGSRPGLSRLLANQPVLQWFSQPWLIQHLSQLTTQVAVQTNASGYTPFLVAVSQGNVYYATPGATSWTLATNLTAGSPPLNFDGLVRSAVCNQLMFFADGTNFCYFEPVTGTVKPWVASDGSLPVDSGNNTPRLIVNWRGRIVQSGLALDPENVFMSAVGEPTTWNYFPATTNPPPTTAVAFNLGPMGLVGDVVNCLIPYSDDVLLIGGAHIIKMMAGDPYAGGQLDLVTDEIGMAWGEPWCKTPDGTVFFVSQKAGIYAWQPGSAPQRISQPIEQLIQAVDTGATGIRLGWDPRYQAVHVFLTPLSEPGPAQHLTLELRTNSWFVTEFANPNHSPLAITTFDGNTQEDRVLLLGSWDGYVRKFDPTATDDDGAPIDSEVVIGPFATPNLDEILLYDLQAVLGESSGDVTYSIYSARSAEAAINEIDFDRVLESQGKTAGFLRVASGTWTSGRNLLSAVRRAGHAFYVRITSTNRWAIEQVRIHLADRGAILRRGF